MYPPNATPPDLEELRLPEIIQKESLSIIQTRFFPQAVTEQENVEQLFEKLDRLKRQMTDLLDAIYMQQQLQKEGKKDVLSDEWFLSLCERYHHLAYLNPCGDPSIDCSVQTKGMPFKLRYRGGAPFYKTLPAYAFTFAFSQRNFTFKNNGVTMYPFTYSHAPSCLLNGQSEQCDQVHAFLEDRWDCGPRRHPHAASNTANNGVFTSICTGSNNPFRDAFSSRSAGGSKLWSQAGFTNTLDGALKWLETINVNDTYNSEAIGPVTQGRTFSTDSDSFHFVERFKATEKEMSLYTELVEVAYPRPDMETLILSVLDQATAFLQKGLSLGDIFTEDTLNAMDTVASHITIPGVTGAPEEGHPEVEPEALIKFGALHAMQLTFKNFADFENSIRFNTFDYFRQCIDAEVLDLPDTSISPAGYAGPVLVAPHAENSGVLSCAKFQEALLHLVAEEKIPTWFEDQGNMVQDQLGLVMTNAALCRYSQVMQLRDFCLLYMLLAWAEGRQRRNSVRYVGLPPEVLHILYYDLSLYALPETNPLESLTYSINSISLPALSDNAWVTLSKIPSYQIYMYRSVLTAKEGRPGRFKPVQEYLHEDVGLYEEAKQFIEVFNRTGESQSNPFAGCLTT